MTDNPIIGRMKCPVCGEQSQDIKVNKNGNLYIFCDNGCRVNFSGKNSRKFRPLLLSGQNINENGFIITSLKGKQQNEAKREFGGITAGTRGTSAGTDAGIEPIRRTNAGFTGVQSSTGTEQQQQKPRGILASFFDDDE